MARVDMDWMILYHLPLPLPTQQHHFPFSQASDRCFLGGPVTFLGKKRKDHIKSILNMPNSRQLCSLCPHWTGRNYPLRCKKE